ncbi:hypothetical protein [Hydrogenovibrio thermophilus]|uniref:Uncharacterized protein n=1 Tax=Hydrogenovibrio thermophilus TaxID=265883 RepID=A0A410H605_9GAMM|nr:hypothetical protein [Hydrogenovibrio thermophilus]QAB16240.1 hypothetical protein EPV75_11485 [Hydrogenovibrio thermophilus]
MTSSPSSHSNNLDAIRTEIIRTSFSNFRQKFSIQNNLFSCVPGINSELASKLYEQISPISLTEYDITQKKQRTHVATPLIFIVDALKHFEKMHEILIDNELIENKDEISNSWNEIKEVTSIALPFFEKQSETYPFLSSEKFIQAIQHNFSKPIDSVEIETQIRRSIHGMKTKQFVYLSLIEPIIHNPSEEKQQYIHDLMTLKAIIFNAFFYQPFYCNFNHSISSALRDLHEAELKMLNIEAEYEDTEDCLITLESLNSQLRSNEYRRLVKSLKTIINFLKKFYKKVSLSKRKGGSGGQKGNKTSHNSWIEINPQTLIKETFFDSEQAIRTINTLSKTDPEELRDTASDELIENVYLDDTSSNNSLPEVRVLNRSSQLQQIEKQNQFLKEELTPNELEQILIGLEKTASQSSVSEKRIRVSILLAVSLFTGYNLLQSHYLRWLAMNPKLRPRYINLSENCEFIYIPTPIYPHSQSSKASSFYFNTQKAMVKLAVPSRFQSILFNLLTAYYSHDKAKKSSAIRNDITQNDIKKVIKSYKLDSRVTINLIQNNFAKNILFYTNGDLWATAAISGREDVISSTQKHYTTVEQPYLQVAYQQAIKNLFFEDIPMNDKPNAKSFLAHGDSFRPKKYEVVKFLNHLSRVIQETYSMLAQPNTNWSSKSVVNTLNLLMIFMETHQSYITGARDIKNPFISPLQLDSENFYTLNDKNINNGYTTRLGYLPSKLVTELEHFIKHIETLLYKLKKQPNFKKATLDKVSLSETWLNAKLSAKRGNSFPGFFLIESRNENKNFVAIPYTRIQAAKIASTLLGKEAETFASLKPNANRHFFRSTLIERGLNPEYIDELMGHRHIGTETWNPKGLFNPRDFRKEVKKTIDLLYKDFVVESPFKKGLTDGAN